MLRFIIFITLIGVIWTPATAITTSLQNYEESLVSSCVCTHLSIRRAVNLARKCYQYLILVTTGKYLLQNVKIMELCERTQNLQK